MLRSPKLDRKYEPKRNNPITLGDDSNLDNDLKPIKVDSKNTIHDLSESELKVRGTIDASTITVDGASVQTGTDAGATELNELSDVTYSDGDLTIDSIDTIISGALTFDSSDDITLDADGDNVFIKAGGGASKFTFDASTSNSPFIKVLSAAGLEECHFKLAIDSNGHLTISNSDGNAGTQAANIILAPEAPVVGFDDCSIWLETTQGVYFDSVVGGTQGNTYISESSTDVLDVYTGGDLMIRLTENGTDGNSVDFNTACAGFTQIEPTFDATDTEVDFRHSNKQKLTLTNNVTDIHFQFPLVSGNFVCVLLQDGTGGRTITNWKTKDAAGNAGAGNSGLVLWAGGTRPSNTETADKADIASFYWDADNEIAYGTYTYNF